MARLASVLRFFPSTNSTSSLPCFPLLVLDSRTGFHHASLNHIVASCEAILSILPSTICVGSSTFDLGLAVRFSQKLNASNDETQQLARMLYYETIGLEVVSAVTQAHLSRNCISCCYPLSSLAWMFQHLRRVRCPRP
jgi:hypothetical protein